MFHLTPSRGGRGRLAAVDFVVCIRWGGFFRVSLFFVFILFERTRLVASMRPPRLIHLSASNDCESCTRPISTNPGSMESGEYGLTRETCFVARRLEVVAVAGLLWISWCVLGGAGFFCFCFFRVLFFLRTHSACCKYVDASCLI